MSIAQIPLGRTSRQDQERQDLKKEFHLNEQQEKEIEARNNDIKRLEKSIKDLHDLFMRMKDLTQSQVRLFSMIVHNHILFEINAGRSRIRDITRLKLTD